MSVSEFEFMTRMALELYYPISRGLHEFGKDKPEGYELLRDMNQIYNPIMSVQIRAQLRDIIGE